MPTAVVILPSSTYRAKDFLDAAAALDIDLVVASEQPAPFDMGDRYLQIDCTDPELAAETIASLGESVPIDGVIAADDQGVMVAAHASTLLGLRGNPVDAAAATRDKLAMRVRLAAQEVPQPGHAPLQPEDDPATVAAGLGYPLVVKPVDRSASQGVIRVDHEDDLQETVNRVRAIVGPRATLLMESYAAGAEIAVEGLMTDGRLSTLAVFDKPDASSGPYFPETIFVTPSRLPDVAIQEAERVARSAVTALGLGSGPVHIELKVDGSRVVVIEVAARSIGGLCSRSLNFGLTGTTLESLILRNAIGRGRDEMRREPVASGVLMIPTPESGILVEVTGVEETRAIPGVTGIDLTIRPGGRVVAPPEGDRYLGFVYARASDPETVESALRKAMSQIEVQVEG